MTTESPVVSRQQRRVLQSAAAILTDEGGVLAGGLSLALRFGHRSEDMDWFVPQAQAGTALIDGLTTIDDVELDRAEPGTIYGKWSGVPFSIIRYRYRLIAEDVFGLPLADLRSVMAMKLLAIVNRGARRDFIDVATCLARGPRLADMIDQATTDIPGLTRDSIMRALAYRIEADAEGDPAGFPQDGWRHTCAVIDKALRNLVKGI